MATRVLAQAPPGEAITPALIEAAKKEGKVNFYTAMEIAVAEPVRQGLRGEVSGDSVRVERSGAERVFSRIAQEYSSRIYNVDLVNTTDAAHALAWKRDGWLAPYVPMDVAQHYARHHVDPDGTFAIVRILFSVVGYNTQLVKPEDAPRGFLDLLDPKWTGKLVKAHPGYSGHIRTATYAIARDLGWEFFEKLAKQKIMQVQSGVDPAEKELPPASRRRWPTAPTTSPSSRRTRARRSRSSIRSRARPIINSPNAVFKAAPNPNAARLFQNWMYSAEGQQTLVDISGQYAPHAQVKPKAGRRPLGDIKVDEGRSRRRS